MTTDETEAAISDPQPGDRWHEMYSFWLYVVAVDGDTVTTYETPSEIKFKTQTKAEFKKRLSYDSIPGYWMALCDREATK